MAKRVKENAVDAGVFLRAAARRDGLVRRSDDGDARASDDACDAPRDDAGETPREDARWRGGSTRAGSAGRGVGSPERAERGARATQTRRGERAVRARRRGGCDARTRD